MPEELARWSGSSSRKQTEGVDHAEAPSSIHHCRAIPREGTAGPYSWPGLELGPRQRLQGNRFCLSLRKVVTAANRRLFLSRRHHWDGNEDFCLGQEGLGSAAEANKPQTTVSFYQDSFLPHTLSPSWVTWELNPHHLHSVPSLKEQCLCGAQSLVQWRERENCC